MTDRKVCPDCHDAGRRGRQLCQTCNGAGLAAPVVGALRRARNALTGVSEVRSEKGIRTTARGSETVRLTPAQRAKLSANQKPAKGKKGNGKGK